MDDALAVISTILKHENKTTSYKIALVRAINDIALSYPDIHSHNTDIAIPLRLIAEFWLAYYWPFADNKQIILQGPRSHRKSGLSQDISFRKELGNFRVEWEQLVNLQSSPSDGFFIINEFNLPRRRKKYKISLLNAYQKVMKKIIVAIKQPIQYSGTENWGVFEKPEKFANISRTVTALPATRSSDVCLVVSNQLWRSFQRMSLYIEALCIHEWCLFTEKVTQLNERKIHRGFIYEILTKRPDNRRPLTWERNQIDVLLMEGKEFTCPWSKKKIIRSTNYDLDHIIPVSVYPMNELWNLVPSDPYYNSHTKRDRLPTTERLHIASPLITQTFQNYQLNPPLSKALSEDVQLRFSLTLHNHTMVMPEEITKSVITFVNAIGNYRNLSRF